MFSLWSPETMDIDTDAIDEAVLALLRLTLHDGHRAWKGHDWDALGRLHVRGLIGDLVNKTKSLVLTEEGLCESERCSDATSSVHGPASNHETNFQLTTLAWIFHEPPLTSG